MRAGSTAAQTFALVGGTGLGYWIRAIRAKDIVKGIVTVAGNNA